MFLCHDSPVTRQVGFESKGLELDLQKTAADYSFDPSEQAGALGEDISAMIEELQNRRNLGGAD